MELRERHDRRLKKAIIEIAHRECKCDDSLLDDVLDRHQKSRTVVKIRERVLRHLRNGFWQKGTRGASTFQTLFQATRPGPDWHPTSFPQIAEHLGGNHTAWVRMEQKIKKAGQWHREFANSA